MILIHITDIEIINYFASIPINMAGILGPIFGAIALLRH